MRIKIVLKWEFPFQDFLLEKNMSEKEYMLRAIELAKRGMGHTNPNPMVGAVIVKNGKIIGEGYHVRYGELHAERNAIASLKESAKGATMYVTLEPCCHHGKTPPCTEAIIEQGIAKVVIGSRDPNPVVSGKGEAILKLANISVVSDFMREECDKLNPVFFHYIQTGTPYVVMKYAMTADGKIATKTGESKWITGETSRQLVQEMRSRYMGIMAGIGTVLADDPMLNVRIPHARKPIRIICDSKLRIPLDSKICQSAKEYPTIVACALNEEEWKYSSKKEQLETLGVEVICVREESGTTVDLKALMQLLGTRKIDSIFLEGGGTLNDAFMRAGLVQEVKAFIAPIIFGGKNAVSPIAGTGIEKISEAKIMKLMGANQIGDDFLLEYKVVEE